MIDFARLTTPVGDGDLLLEPPPARWSELSAANAAALAGAPPGSRPATLAERRRRTRAALGFDDRTPLIVVGHQPEFMHAGVFVKNIAAASFASACGGSALNLVVDNDVPRSPNLRVPVFNEPSVDLVEIPALPVRAGIPYEHLGGVASDALARVADRTRDLLADAWASSLMPVFFSGATDPGADADWVGALSAGRRNVERKLGIGLRDLRVRDLPWHDFVGEVLRRRDEFAGVHNVALADYRRTQGVRGGNRPIPDLTRRGDLIEVPFWLTRPGATRQRCFARERDNRIELVAEDDARVDVPLTALSPPCDALPRVFADAGWAIRPRALTLTMWARVFLADVFIHGIGGAKYDRITDQIIRRFFGVAPPAYLCVSATLRLPISGPPRPTSGLNTPVSHPPVPTVRELRFNPQRHIHPDAQTSPLLQARAAAIADAVRLRFDRPRDARARRAVFDHIRRASEALLALRPDIVAAARAAEASSAESARTRDILTDREYFFALHPRSRIEALVRRIDALIRDRADALGN
ncbi:MAG: hypothetical protein FLDDKLPJ_02490 [Phycisphaerae bacterium]|nr:hypothetical protein [Phycisphaerae bacterium]